MMTNPKAYEYDVMDEAPGQLLQNEMILMMLRTIGEEFNRPLGLIANNCEYLQTLLPLGQSPEVQETAKTALADINTSALHLNRLMENFIEMNASLHGVQAPSLVLVDLVSVLRGVCADSEEIYRAIGIHLQCDFGTLKQALVMADRAFAERICLNLLSNALHACTENEHVVFSLRETPEGFALQVIDDGYGFPAENIVTAFSPLQNRTLGAAQGFERGGKMGLYLCGEYCRLMGWGIAIACKDPGTQVSIDIPHNHDAYCRDICFHTQAYEQEQQELLTRMQVLRELRTVPGLEHLRRRR